jgi:hypothetical protein
MIIDSQEVLSSAQAVTATGDTASTNVLDTAQTLDEGIGEPAYIVVKINTAVTSGGSATVQAVLQTSTDNSTFTDVVSGVAKTVGTDSVIAGVSLLKTRLPAGLSRYIRVVYRIGTAVLTAGKFDAFIAKDVQAQQFGAAGFTVDV